MQRLESIENLDQEDPEAQVTSQATPGYWESVRKDLAQEGCGAPQVAPKSIQKPCVPNRKM